MIPYVAYHSFPLGPLTIQVWGLMVGLGILCGAAVAVRFAAARGQDPKVIWDLAFWIVIASFLGGRLFHVIVYNPGFYLQHPDQILAIWNGGMSIIGGFIGALLITIWYLRKRRVDVLAYADTTIFGLPLGLFIGRIGCFLIHDHPGTATHFFLGVRYPDGIVRHDHGLYLSLNGLVLFGLFLFMRVKKARTGSYLIVFLLYYGATRFALDFLRASDGLIVDLRYFGLTPAQYASLVMVLGGVWLWRNRAASAKAVSPLDTSTDREK